MNVDNLLQTGSDDIKLLFFLRGEVGELPVGI